jgi:hypothetical protein
MMSGCEDTCLHDLEHPEKDKRPKSNEVTIPLLHQRLDRSIDTSQSGMLRIFQLDTELREVVVKGHCKRKSVDGYPLSRIGIGQRGFAFGKEWSCRNGLPPDPVSQKVGEKQGDMQN